MNTLLFTAEHKFDVTLNPLLKAMAEFHQWNSKEQVYEYVFKLSSLPAVSELIGPVVFNRADAVLVAEQSREKVESFALDGWKGKSGFHVVEFPTEYVVQEWQKPKGGKPVMVEHSVPKERVVKLWRGLFEELPEHEYFAYKYLAPKVCRLFGLSRYFRESGSFDGAKFQGGRTSSDYGAFYYYPMKVLEHYRVVSRRGQWLARASVEWGEQCYLEAAR